MPSSGRNRAGSGMDDNDTRRVFLAKAAAIMAAPLLPAAPGQPAAKRKMILHPEEFGAVGDGEADDVESWEALLETVQVIKQRYPQLELEIRLGMAALYRFSRPIHLGLFRMVTAVSRRGYLINGEWV